MALAALSATTSRTATTRLVALSDAVFKASVQPAGSGEWFSAFGREYSPDLEWDSERLLKSLPTPRRPSVHVARRSHHASARA
jgi:hypothetical protein